MRVRWVLPRAWAVALGTLMLGPALGPGYVLSYDMVWVPDLALRPDFLGVGTGLPRAVPSDAVVAVLDEVVPGMLLQKLVLLGVFVAGGWGAVHLAPSGSVVGQLTAVSVYLWNPFVTERLAIGHWPVLAGYAVLPWILTAARGGTAAGLPARLWLLIPLGSLSASAGVVTAVAVAVTQVGRSAPRRALLVSVLLGAANAPWVFSGLLHAESSTTSAEAVRVFDLAGVDGVPAWIAALALGGSWNAEVVLPSRTMAVVLLHVAVLVVLVAVGRRAWSRQPFAGSLLVCWVVGWGAAVAMWALPGGTAWVMERVPGAAVVRDGSRLLALCAPLLASVVAHGADVLVRRAPGRLAAVALSVGLCLFPVALMPDASWGLSGRLQAVAYPDSYVETREALQRRRASGADGDVLTLPFFSYRAPEWNDGRKVLDPLGRFLPVDYVSNDELSVSGNVLPGEDPRARLVASALAESGDEARAQALADLGIRWVVSDTSVPVEVPEVTGDEVVATAGTRLIELDAVRTSPVPATWVWTMVAAWVLFLTLVAVGAVLQACRASRPGLYRLVRW